MENVELANLLNNTLIGQEGFATCEFEGNSNRPLLQLGVFEKMEAINGVSLKFSKKTVAIFTPLWMITIVANMKEDGSWTTEEICSELYIGGKSFWQIIKEVTS